MGWKKGTLNQGQRIGLLILSKEYAKMSILIQLKPLQNKVNALSMNCRQASTTWCIDKLPMSVNSWEHNSIYKLLIIRFNFAFLN